MTTKHQRKKAVSELIYRQLNVTRADVERELGYPQATVIRILNNLIRDNVIKKSGNGRNTEYHPAYHNDIYTDKKEKNISQANEVLMQVAKSSNEDYTIHVTSKENLDILRAFQNSNIHRKRAILCLLGLSMDIDG